MNHVSTPRLTRYLIYIVVFAATFYYLARTYGVLVIDMSVEHPTRAQVFFNQPFSQPGDGFTEASSQSLQVQAGRQTYRVVVPVPFAQLRLDPADRMTGIKLHGLRLISAYGALNQGITDLSTWTPVHQISGLTRSESGLEFRSDGQDPHIISARNDNTRSWPAYVLIMLGAALVAMGFVRGAVPDRARYGNELLIACGWVAMAVTISVSFVTLADTIQLAGTAIGRPVAEDELSRLDRERTYARQQLRGRSEVLLASRNIPVQTFFQLQYTLSPVLLVPLRPIDGVPQGLPLAAPDVVSEGPPGPADAICLWSENQSECPEMLPGHHMTQDLGGQLVLMTRDTQR